MRESGFELEKVHELEAFIYFPNESNARRALPALQQAGYTTYPEPTGEGRWVVEAVIRAAPMPEYVAAMRRHLRGVAGPLGGLYDGWSATPIDEEAEAEAARLAELEPQPAPLLEAQPEADAEAQPTAELDAPAEAAPEAARDAQPLAGPPAEGDAEADVPPQTQSTGETAAETGGPDLPTDPETDHLPARPTSGG